MLLTACGMVLYSAINSPGYFAPRGEWPLVAMFAAICGGTLSALTSAARPSVG